MKHNTDVGTLQPLTDVFTSNQQASPSPTAKSRLQKPAFNVAEDKENAPVQDNSSSRQTVLTAKPNADPSFRGQAIGGSPFRQAPVIPPKSPFRSPLPKFRGLVTAEPTIPRGRTPAEDAKESEESFVSADEAPENKRATQETEVATQQDEVADRSILAAHETANRVTSHAFSVSAETDAGMQEAAQEVERTSPLKAQAFEKASSASESPSPERPVIRKKSSLNLASLPPRDPLNTKKSFGTARESSRGFSTFRDSYLHRNKQSQGPELAQKANIADDDEDQLGFGKEEGEAGQPQQSEPTMLPNKTSTQRLHERMKLLGQSKAPRPSKSITSSMAHQHVAPRKTDNLDITSSKLDDEKDDDWIAPISQNVQAVEKEVAEAVDVASQQANIPLQRPPTATATATYPDLTAATLDSTTPAGSPNRWPAEGPLSASKAKFQSFLRSAKGMFATSAAVSAQAKMGTMPSSPSRKPVEELSQLAKNEMDAEPHPPAYPKTAQRKRSASQGPLNDEHEASQQQPPTKRRSSQRVSERRAQEAQIAPRDQGLEPFNSSMQQSTTGDASKMSDNAESQDSDQALDSKQPTSRAPKAADQPSKTIENKRLKPFARPTTVSKAKPGQISVMVPSMRPQLGASTNAAKSTSQHASAGQSTAAARPPLQKKPSDSSLRSASSQSMRSGPTNQKLKALESARRKKEQEDKEQQRKEEQKKTLDRKRAEKAEEERQAHERKLAEQKREAEARVAAQKRVVEQQRVEKQQREDQLRSQAEAARSRMGVDTISKSQTGGFSGSKVERLPGRPESRGQESSRPTMPHINPAKPVKRVFNPDTDDVEAPGAGFRPSFAAQKKPKVSEEFELRTQQQSLTRPVMGAPMRPSMAKKQDLPARFQHGFMSSAGASQPGSSMLKSAINTSQQMHGFPKTPHDMAKFANARIPFAEAPNPPGPQNMQAPSSHSQSQRALQKTPATINTAGKSSPAFPNGDNISLPEIATDSEDEDSDDAFEAPAWTNSPELRQLLEQQQLVDPMRVFGPIAPLSMEEVFKGASKDRMKRFRDRTSSANWNGPDRLTEEERRRDREAREKLERDGGWTYETSVQIEKSGR